jgi:plasmid maintenance system antidote protein VapI
MQLSKDKVASLIQERAISQNGLARLLNVRPGSLSNALSGKRGVGRQILSALLREFEGESVASFTIPERHVVV